MGLKFLINLNLTSFRWVVVPGGSQVEVEPSDFQVVSLLIEISYAEYFRAILGHRQSDKQNSSQHGMFIMVVHRRCWKFGAIPIYFGFQDDDGRDFTIHGAINLSLTIS